MSDPTGGAQLKPQDAVMWQLGKLEGKVDAILSSQHDQAAVNAENKKEHDEFRKQLGDHAEVIAVLKDNKQTANTSRAELWTRVGIWVAIAGVMTTAVLTIIWH